MRKTIGASEGASIYLLGICAGSLLSLFLSLILRASGAADAQFDGMNVYSWCGYALMQFGFIGTVLLYSSVRKCDLVHIAKIKGKLNAIQIAILPFVSVATILVFLPLANAWTAFLNVIGYHGAGVAMPNYSNVGVYFLSLLSMAVLPALGEELLVRGGLFSGLSTRNVWFGVLMSALLFSLMHANPVQTVHQFGLGIVLALAVGISGSIWAGVLVHFFNNFISITLTAYIPQIDAVYEKLGYFNWLTGFASVVCGALLLVFLLYAFYRAGNRKSQNGVSSVYEEDGYTIILSSNTPEKGNFFRDFGTFFKSIFTKNGLKNITYRLEESNAVEYVGKSQNMTGVWIALAFVCVYWLYGFIVGLL